MEVARVPSREGRDLSLKMPSWLEDIVNLKTIVFLLPL